MCDAETEYFANNVPTPYYVRPWIAQSV